jgi:uncharacterized protein YkwD
MPKRLRYLLGIALLSIAGAAQLGLAPQLLALKLPWSTPYDYGEEWASYLAPPDVCPGSDDHLAPTEEQEQTMLCLINWARTAHGLEPLQFEPRLAHAARLKTLDMTRCDEFRHQACGKPTDATARAAGYPIGRPGVAFGENIAWGSENIASPRVIMDGWLHSAGHRRNILHPTWTEQAIALRRAEFQGEQDAAVWVSQFGRRRSA